MQRNDVRPRVQLVKRHIGDPGRRGIRVVGTEIVSDDLHAEAPENADQLTGDPARADDAGRLAVEIEAQQTVEREIPVPRAPIGAMDFAVERQHERHGVLRHGMRRVGGDPHHGNPVLRRREQVHVVETRAAQGDQPHAQLREACDGRGVGRIVHEDADDVGPFGQRYVPGVEMAAVIGHVESVRIADAVERLTVVRLCPEKSDFHVRLRLTDRHRTFFQSHLLCRKSGESRGSGDAGPFSRTETPAAPSAKGPSAKEPPGRRRERFLRRHFFVFRYSVGDSPVCFLKNRPRYDWSGKWSR